MYHSNLNAPALAKLKKIGKADLVIALATYKTTPKIASKVAQQAIIGVQTYYPHLKTVLINADAGHKNNTRRAIQKLNNPALPVISSRYEGILGKGASISAILHAALQLQPKAIVILDSNTKSISPEWVPGLATPILDHQADLVKPRYMWPLPEGALNDLLFYPFTRAIWGGNLRHPAAPDYALSSQLAEAVLAQDVWQTEVNRAGFDIWLSTFAITGDWHLAQTALGDKESLAVPYNKQTLVSFQEAVGTMLRQIYVGRKTWPRIDQMKSFPSLTEFAPLPHSRPTPFNNGADYIEALTLGWMEYRSLWQRIMLPENLTSVEYLASKPINQFYFPPDLWAKIAYDFTVVYNKGERDPDTVIASLYPLYLGRLASFWSEIAGLTTVGRAGTVAAQAVEFEEHLPYLKYRWDTYLPWLHSDERR